MKKLFIIFSVPIVFLLVANGCGDEEPTPFQIQRTDTAPSKAPRQTETAMPPQADEVKETLEWQLAVIQYGATVPKDGPEVDTFKKLLDSIDNKTINTRQECSDMTVKTWQLVNEQGVNDDLLFTMRQLDEALVEGDIKWDLAEVASMYIVLRTQ
ncbi:MAG: hypothetical protein IBX64_12855 [Actinobacteria bacterium]|nr:hypothetical protein [Actinomycetota bacterium]